MDTLTDISFDVIEILLRKEFPDFRIRKISTNSYHICHEDDIYNFNKKSPTDKIDSTYSTFMFQDNAYNFCINDNCTNNCVCKCPNRDDGETLCCQHNKECEYGCGYNGYIESTKTYKEVVNKLSDKKTLYWKKVVTIKDIINLK